MFIWCFLYFMKKQKLFLVHFYLLSFFNPFYLQKKTHEKTMKKNLNFIFLKFSLQHLNFDFLH